MLQGNPFETQLTVDERTKTVRHEAEQVQLPPGIHSYGERLRQWWPTIPSLDIDSVAEWAIQVTKSTWWVPAGFGILVLLNAIRAM